MSILDEQKSTGPDQENHLLVPPFRWRILVMYFVILCVGDIILIWQPLRTSS